MLAAFAALSVVVWLVLLTARGGFWRADARLPDSPAPAAWPAVAAVTPARDEAGTVAAVVAAIQASDYPGALSHVVVDDGSADGTAEIARAAGRDGARPLAVRAGAALEPGWTGKLWALEQGVAAADPAARYLLFCDADIALAETTIRRLVALAEDRGLALASLMARLDARGVWGRLLIPAFVFFFQKLYPFPLANDPRRATAAAAGGCVLIRRDALEEIGGLAALRGALIDDCALAALVKRPGRDGRRRGAWIGLADLEAVSLRDNRRLGSIWTMVTRTAFVQLRRSWLLLAGCVAGMGLTYLAGPAIVLTAPWHDDLLAAILGGQAWSLMTAAYLPTARLYGGGLGRALTLPFAALIYTAMTADSARRDLMGAGGAWKGRTYPAA